MDSIRDIKQILEREAVHRASNIVGCGRVKCMQYPPSEEILLNQSPFRHSNSVVTLSLHQGSQFELKYET